MGVNLGSDDDRIRGISNGDALIGLISDRSRHGRLETGETTLSSLGGDFTDQIDLRSGEAIRSVVPLMRR
jgi:DNA gyrase subunit A